MSKNLSNEQFIKFRDFIHANYGIFYADIKKDLLKIKIDKCMLKEKMESYDDYFWKINETNNTYLRRFVDEITVNKTEFFREKEQFDFIENCCAYIKSDIPSIEQNKQIKVWSMACSTGQEPFSIAMVLLEKYSECDIKILATDINKKVLSHALDGKYQANTKNDIDKYYINKYFNHTNDEYEIKKNVRDLVTFRHFNIINTFPFKEKFDMIFCRNVMIYFDEKTQKEIISKIEKCLSPGGYLFLGLSESMLNKNQQFKAIKSSIYKRKY